MRQRIPNTDSKPQDRSLLRFLRWVRALLGLEKRQPLPRILEQVRSGPKGKLAAYERFTPGARYTWRFVPHDGEYQAWLYCDSLTPSGRATLATHTLTLLIISRSGATQAHWYAERNMRSLAGENNCAAIVTRILAAQLLRHEYQDIPWALLADRLLRSHLPGPG